jgi:hypothetical protein
MLRLKILGAIPSQPIYPHGVHRDRSNFSLGGKTLRHPDKGLLISLFSNNTAATIQPRI